MTPSIEKAISCKLHNPDLGTDYEDVMTTNINTLVREFDRYGYQRITIMLRAAGGLPNEVFGK
jgi:hypothetical protein